MSTKDALYFYTNRLATTDPHREPMLYAYYAAQARIQLALVKARRNVDFPAPEVN